MASSSWVTLRGGGGARAGNGARVTLVLQLGSTVLLADVDSTTVERERWMYMLVRQSCYLKSTMPFDFGVTVPPRGLVMPPLLSLPWFKSSDDCVPVVAELFRPALAVVAPADGDLTDASSDGAGLCSGGYFYSP